MKRIHMQDSFSKHFIFIFTWSTLLFFILPYYDKTYMVATSSSLLNFSFSHFPQASVKQQHFVLFCFSGLSYLLCSSADAKGDLKAAIGKRKWNMTWKCPHRTQSANSGQVTEDRCVQMKVLLALLLQCSFPYRAALLSLQWLPGQIVPEPGCLSYAIPVSGSSSGQAQ